MASKPMQQKREADVLKEIIQWLKSQRIRHWRNNTQGNIKWGEGGMGVLVPSSRVGSPDIEGQLKDGRYFCIEVKRPGWKPPKEPATLAMNKPWSHYARQRQWLRETVENNGIGFFALSLDDVIKELGGGLGDDRGTTDEV